MSSLPLISLGLPGVKFPLPTQSSSVTIGHPLNLEHLGTVTACPALLHANSGIFIMGTEGIARQYRGEFSGRFEVWQEERHFWDAMNYDTGPSCLCLAGWGFHLLVHKWKYVLVKNLFLIASEFTRKKFDFIEKWQILISAKY